MGDIQLGLRRKSRKTNAEIRFGSFTIRDRKTDHDPLASRTYSLHHLPKTEKAAEALTYLMRWFDYAHVRLHHTWRDNDYAIPSLTKIPRSGQKRTRHSNYAAFGARTFRKVGVRWGAPMSDSNFTQVLNIIADAAGQGGHEVRKQNGNPIPSGRREENLLGDSLVPDAVSCSSASLKDFQDIDYGFGANVDGSEFGQTTDTTADSSSDPLSPSLSSELENAPLNRLRDMVKKINPTVTQETVKGESLQTQAGRSCDDAADTSRLLSELPDVKLWREYVTQYWTLILRATRIELVSICFFMNARLTAQGCLE
ncbi:unnamed protein product [Phytophthora lilii]|uniref:Unnamed protein product n=1 Tax=Phytophthora lilii TaxID=2077276 RepID=A0A9W7CSY8_9STRA|nr:unnamed protein product [Phytophthora lilii]